MFKVQKYLYDISYPTHMKTLSHYHTSTITNTHYHHPIRELSVAEPLKSNLIAHGIAIFAYIQQSLSLLMKWPYKTNNFVSKFKLNCDNIFKMKFLILLVWITSLSNASQEDPIQPCQDDQSNYNHNWKSLGDWKKIIEKTTCNGDSNYVSTRLSHKLSIIVDTDIGGFADDPTAMAVLHGLANQGKVDILAMVGSTRYEGIAMAMDVINTFFGRPHIPLGVTKDPKAYSDKQGSQNWTEYIRDHFKHRINKNAEVEDSIIVLRRTLAAAPDHSVMILQIGHFTNLANLLNTPPDKISHLFGYQLVSQKVTEVVTMAGMFPTGKEWNIEKDAISARSFAKNWPTP